MELAVDHASALHVPAAVVAQVWREGARQARLARLLRARGLAVQELDLDEARACGVLCGRSSTSDVVDASVALLARRHSAVVVTSDPDDLRRLDPDLRLVLC